MDFEHLLRRYLDGALSTQEMERFQSLLDRVPDYKDELRRTLEVRSMLHDDALTLTPPPDLSDHIRIAVSSSFAADAIEQQEMQLQERRRRAIVYPFRIATTALVAVCLLVGVALTPTVPDSMATGSVAEADMNALGSSSRSDDAIADMSEVADAPVMAVIARPVSSLGRDRTRGSSIVRRDATRAPKTYFSMLSHEIFMLRNASDNSGSISNGSVAVNNTLYPPLLSGSLKRDIATQDFNPQPTALPAEQTGLQLIADKPSDTRSAKDYRTLTFGVLVGSGHVAETKSLTALLQNSYYFSVGMSPNDRIGIEMGASAFQREETVSQSTAHPTALAKGSVGSPDGGSGEGRGGGSDPLPQPKLVAQRYEQQITYGAVYYDRRIKLNKQLDICGRVTVGGANSSLVGNVRGYIAYTPSAAKSITLTMGVGGAGLYDLTARGSSASGNYGVYYGIETGF